MVIGLGGLGTSVVHRLRAVLVSGAGGKVPESIRLLAFDISRPHATTGRLGEPYYFLTRIPIPEDQILSTRRETRRCLLQDLERGAPGSLVLRGLSMNMEALRRAGSGVVDVFLVTSTFGLSGASWLVDMAYLCRRVGQGRVNVNVHALLLLPETCRGAFPINRAHQLGSFTLLKEIENFQKSRDWKQPYSLYTGQHLAGLPGLLTGAPFNSVQIMDAQSLGGLPEQTAVPAAAEGILCQLDEQVAQILRQSSENRPPDTTGQACFSSIGIQALIHPTRLLVQASVQREILGLVEALLPLQKDPSGLTTTLAPAPLLLPDDPYSDVQRWLGNFGVSGVLTDVFYQAGLYGSNSSNARQAWVARLADRDTAQWKATLFGVAGAADLLPPNGEFPEILTPFIRRHFEAYLGALARKTAALFDDPSGPQENLARLENILTDYIADLGRAEEQLKRRGKHYEAEPLRRAVEETRRDWENKKNSSFARLFPQRVEEAQERYLAARQAQLAFQQHEALIKAVRNSADLMLTLTRRLLEAYQYYARALALSPESLYNLAQDAQKRIQREIEREEAVRSQRFVVDEAFEERQLQLVFDDFIQRVFSAVQASLLSIASSGDWITGSIALRVSLDDPEALDGVLDLTNFNRQPEETALLLSRWLNRLLEEKISTALGQNNILNFIHYLNPQASQLGAQLVESSTPLARTFVPPARQMAFLCTPNPDAPNSSPYMRELVYELYHQLGELYQVPSGDPDRLVLFRRFDAINLDNLMAFQDSIPSPLDPKELRPYLLWNS